MSLAFIFASRAFKRRLEAHAAHVLVHLVTPSTRHERPEIRRFCSYLCKFLLHVRIDKRIISNNQEICFIKRVK